MTLGGGHCGRALAGPEVALPVTALAAGAPEVADSDHTSECPECIFCSLPLLPQKGFHLSFPATQLGRLGPFVNGLLKSCAVSLPVVVGI